MLRVVTAKRHTPPLPRCPIRNLLLLVPPVSGLTFDGDQLVRLLVERLEHIPKGSLADLAQAAEASGPAYSRHAAAGRPGRNGVRHQRDADKGCTQRGRRGEERSQWLHRHTYTSSVSYATATATRLHVSVDHTGMQEHGGFAFTSLPVSSVVCP